MARIRNRIVKADYYTDPELLRWHRDKRETYRGLWAIAEDSGCLEDDPFGWKVLIWPSPMDADITVELLAKWRDELIEAGKLVPYEAEGKRYLWIRNFHQHEQPPNPQRPDLPLPPWVECEATHHDRGNGRVTRCRYHVDITGLPQGCDRPITELSPPYRTVPNHTYTFGAPTSGDAPVETVENLSEPVENYAAIEKATEQLKESEPYGDIDWGESTPKPDRRTEAQRLIGYFIDERVRRGRSKPTRTQVGVLANIVGEKLAGGAKPEALREAVRQLVEKGKPATHLPAIIDEVEAARARQPGPGPIAEPEMTPEERAASIRAAREASEMVRALAAGVGRAMP